MTDNVDAARAGAGTRPVVILGCARTLGWRLATSIGGPRWIGAAEPLRFGHRLRVERDAITVGASPVPCGGGLILDGRVEYPGAQAMSVESEEAVGCVTAS